MTHPGTGTHLDRFVSGLGFLFTERFHAGLWLYFYTDCRPDALRKLPGVEKVSGRTLNLLPCAQIDAVGRLIRFEGKQVRESKRIACCAIYRKQPLKTSSFFVRITSNQFRQRVRRLLQGLPSNVGVMGTHLLAVVPYKLHNRRFRYPGVFHQGNRRVADTVEAEATRAAATAPAFTLTRHFAMRLLFPQSRLSQ